MIRDFDEMITGEGACRGTFALELFAVLMAKTKHQEAATAYAGCYLESIIDFEDRLGRRVEEKVDIIMDRKIRDILDEKLNK